MFRSRAVTALCLALAAAALLAACAPSPRNSSAPSVAADDATPVAAPRIVKVGARRAPTVVPWSTPYTTMPTPAQVPAELTVAVQAAREDAAAWLGVDVDAVYVLAIRPVTWSDASLGCPEPERQYADMVEPEYSIPATPTGLTVRELIRRDAASLDRVPLEAVEITSDLPAAESPWAEVCGRTDGYIVELSLPGGIERIYHVGADGTCDYCKG